MCSPTLLTNPLPSSSKTLVMALRSHRHSARHLLRVHHRHLRLPLGRSSMIGEGTRSGGGCQSTRIAVGQVAIGAGIGVVTELGYRRGTGVGFGRGLGRGRLSGPEGGIEVVTEVGERRETKVGFGRGLDRDRWSGPERGGIGSENGNDWKNGREIGSSY